MEARGRHGTLTLGSERQTIDPSNSYPNTDTTRHVHAAQRRAWRRRRRRKAGEKPESYTIQVRERARQREKATSPFCVQNTGVALVVVVVVASLSRSLARSLFLIKGQGMSLNGSPRGDGSTENSTPAPW